MEAIPQSLGSVDGAIVLLLLVTFENNIMKQFSNIHFVVKGIKADFTS